MRHAIALHKSLAKRGFRIKRKVYGDSLRMVGAGTNQAAAVMRGGPAVVLVRPQLAVNIGMAARAMANFGLSDLRLVAPREGDSRHTLKKGASQAASGAVYILEGAKFFDTVEAATADLNFLWATTARERGQDKRVLLPEHAMRECAARLGAGENHGVMFGPERTGLENDEIALADAIITFPVNPAYASLNLAQAVLLTGYEWMRASGAALPFDNPKFSPTAPREMVHSFFEFIEEALERNGYYRPLAKAPVMKRNMRNLFHRMQLTEQDIRTMRGALVRLVKGPRFLNRKVPDSSQNSAKEVVSDDPTP